MLFVIEIASAVIAVAFVFVEIVLPLWKRRLPTSAKQSSALGSNGRPTN
jgi:uncharacterized protein YoxC